jgi:carbohydrate-selective porin OprB
MGNVRASYDPSSGPGVEIKFIPEKHVYVKTAYIMPSSKETSYPTGFNYQNGSFGSTSDTEIGFYTDPGAPDTRKSYPGIIKAGFIYNGGRNFPDYNALKYVSGNYTIYGQFNQPVLRVKAGSNRGVDVTFGFNAGPRNKSAVPDEFTAGIIFNGPIPGRGKDSLDFGYVYSKISGYYNFALVTGNVPPFFIPSPSLQDEKAYEANYKAQVFPWLVLQPVVQFYANVGGRTHGSATLAGLRLVTTF